MVLVVFHLHPIVVGNALSAVLTSAVVFHTKWERPLYFCGKRHFDSANDCRSVFHKMHQRYFLNRPRHFCVDIERMVSGELMLLMDFVIIDDERMMEYV